MELKQIDALISESLRLQGRMEGIQEEVKSLEGSVRQHDVELARLDAVMKAKKTAMEKLSGLQKEMSEVSSKLEENISKLKADGYILPLGKSKATRQVQL